MYIVFLVLLGLLGGCASDPAKQQRIIESVQTLCLAEARNYVETGTAKDYFTQCVDSRLLAVGEDPIYDLSFEDRWPEFENHTTGQILPEKQAESRTSAFGPITPKGGPCGR